MLALPVADGAWSGAITLYSIIHLTAGQRAVAGARASALSCRSADNWLGPREPQPPCREAAQDRWRADGHRISSPWSALARPSSTAGSPNAPTTRRRPDLVGIDRGGRTSLHYAALANDADAVSTLLTQGADPNAPDRLGFTASHFAAQEGACAAAEILLAPELRWTPSTATGAPLCGRRYSTAADAVSSSSCYAATWHPNNTGHTPAGTARLIGTYDVAQFFADLSDPNPKT
jgi:hypothetical protein